MIFTARQIAGILNGTVEGNPDAQVSTVSKIEEGAPGSLSFLANPKYTDYIYSTKASAVIVAKDFKPQQPLSTTLIRVDDAYQSFAKLLEYYNKLNKDKKGREEQSYVSTSAKIGNDVYIGAFVYVGENAEIGNAVKLYPGTYIGDDVKVGANTTLFQGVKIYHGCVIGNDCTLHAGVVIGGDGFGFAPNAENNYAKVPQIGNVVIEDRVEIGANTTIDRATLGSTIIRKGVKLDNLIQIAHNVEIGENTVIAAQTGVAGSTKIGSNCMIGGQVGIIGHITIGDKVMIAAQSGIGGNLKDGEIVQGSPAFGVGEYKRSYVVFRKLPELNAKIAELEKKLKELKQENE
ncbi:MAG: UDP-3-O-(3-hydroxymyristoyl)glucosamine N-acyltransferase [Bacteroidia bacterium]